MIDTCDPDADVSTLRKLIKMNTGQTIKLTKEEICDVYEDIKRGKLPLPPLVMNSSKTYLLDKKSPLTPKEYEVLFKSSSKRTELRKIAKKVGLMDVEKLSKCDLVSDIGKRLRYMNVHEPVQFFKKTAFG